jgi:hypothetical protein
MRAPLLLVLLAAGSPLTDAIHGDAYPIAVAGKKLDGKGAPVLRTAITAANFVMLGEDHGIAWIPQFGAALCISRVCLG